MAMLQLLTLSLALSWVQVRSDAFVVRSSAGEERARQVLKALEAFHQAVGRLAFESVPGPEIPIEVLVLGENDAIRELAPEFAGASLQVVGYYQRGDDRDFIVLSGRVSPQTSTRVVYHELTHYFLTQYLRHRPTWLSEGLAEYFAAAEIVDDDVFLGGVAPDRAQALNATRLLSLGQLMAVDHTSPYYNEGSKANVFYLQSWAFTHFLLHQGYARNFRLYLEALTRGDASLFDFLGSSPSQIETEFRTYLSSGALRRVVRQRMASPVETRPATLEPVDEAVIHVTKAEILLAMNSPTRARIHVERAVTLDAHGPRVSYVRGILARAGNEMADAREFFVDALVDPVIGSLAAVQLMAMRELGIPGVRASLEAAAAAGPRVPSVYWALAEVYLEDRRRIEETVRLTPRPQPPLPLPAPGPSRSPAPPIGKPPVIYFRGEGDHFRYELLSTGTAGPAVRTVVEPYYPEELRREKAQGEVILEIEIAADGSVAGLRTVSATPEVFSGLAENAVREWRFDARTGKITVIVRFVP